MKKLKFDHVKKQQAPRETRLVHKDDDGEHTKECEVLRVVSTKTLDVFSLIITI